MAMSGPIQTPSLRHTSAKACASILSLLPEPSDTTVYVDEVAYQAIRWSFPGGVDGLIYPEGEFGTGVRDVKHISAPLPSIGEAELAGGSLAFPEGGHVAFMFGAANWVSASLFTHTRAILQARRSLGGYSSCTIFVGVPKEYTLQSIQMFRDATNPELDRIIADAGEDGGSASGHGVSSRLEQLISSWLLVGTDNPSSSKAIRIHHIPTLATVNTSEQAFLLPDIADVFPLSRETGKKDPLHVRRQTDRVSVSILGFLTSLGFKGDLYALGEFSERVSKKATNSMMLGQRGAAHIGTYNISSFVSSLSSAPASSTSGPKEQSKPAASIVLIDRALDVGGVVGPSPHLIDMIYQELSAHISATESDAFRAGPNDISIPARAIVSDAIAPPTPAPYFSPPQPPGGRGGHLRVLGYSMVDAVSARNRFLLSQSLGSDVLPANDMLSLWEALVAQDARPALQLERRMLRSAVEGRSFARGAAKPILTSTRGDVAHKQLNELLALARENSEAVSQHGPLLVLSAALSLAMDSAEELGRADMQARVDKLKQALDPTIELIVSDSRDPLGADATEALSLAWYRVLEEIPEESVPSDAYRERVAELGLDPHVATEEWLYEHGRVVPLLVLAASLLSPCQAPMPYEHATHIAEMLLSNYAQVHAHIAFRSSGRNDDREASQRGSRWANLIVDTLAALAGPASGANKQWARWKRACQAGIATGRLRGGDGSDRPRSLLPLLARDVLQGAADPYRELGISRAAGSSGGSSENAIGNMLAGFGRRFLRASSQVATSYASGGDGSANVSPTYPSADTLNSASPLSSPSPSPILANPAIIFFIVGGVTFDEIRQINQLAIEVAPSYTVLIGSNLIASAPQFLQQLIKSI